MSTIRDELAAVIRRKMSRDIIRIALHLNPPEAQS